MPYVFGAATADDITWAPGQSFGGTNTNLLVTGWWMPTTLTATRGLWSVGNTIGAEIDTTTTSLRLRSDNTTDGQWTVPVAFTVNQWKFLAFFVTFNNTGPAVTWKVWAGTIDTPPVAATVTTATSPVGNNTANANFYVGNKGTGSLAFQGEIAHVSTIGYDGTGATETGNPFYLSAHGAVDATQEQVILEHFVWPAYLGDFRRMLYGTQRGFAGGSGQPGQWHNALDIGAVLVGGATGTNSGQNVTINGATSSVNDSPRPLNGPATLPFVRR